MKQIILFAGAAALFASAAPAQAKPGHAKGHGKPAHAENHHGKRHAKPAHVENRHGNGSLYGHGLGGCPPGHSKHPGVCMPHGQWKKQFEVGQRLPAGFNGLLGYDGLPKDLRGYYGAQLDPYSRYLQDQNYVYRVDPRTMVVQQVLSAILRP